MFVLSFDNANVASLERSGNYPHLRLHCGCLLLMQALALTLRACKGKFTGELCLAVPLRHHELASATTFERQLVAGFQHGNIGVVPIITHHAFLGRAGFRL